MQIRPQKGKTRQVAKVRTHHKGAAAKPQKPWVHPEPVRVVADLARATVEAYGVQHHPVAVAIVQALEARRFGQVVEAADSISRQLYAEMPFVKAYGLNQLAALVTKVPFEAPELNPDQKAWEVFHAGEHRCKRTNQRFRAMKSNHRLRYLSIRAKARAYIRYVLGDSPPLGQIYDRCDFGPGACVGVHGETTHAMAKLHSPEWTCTPSCIDYAYGALLHNQHAWHATVEHLYGDVFSLDPDTLLGALKSRITYVDYNKIALVLKNAKVKRTIAMEALLNSFVQKGTDTWMREQLVRVGIFLRSQQVNQRLAMLGSLGLSNPFVTLDLEGASDSISMEAVKDLIPPEWFEFLCCLRSPRYMLPSGETRRYEKFTSMGNGFCFPLETLIFASLAYSVGVETGDCDKLGAPYWSTVRRAKVDNLAFAVYGDDIIVRQSSALYLTEVLKFYGFRLNRRKSFITGPFRESCGADFLRGVNVRPYYIRSLPTTEVEFYKLGNALRSSPYPSFALWDLIFSEVPYDVRKVRPYEGSPETCFTADLDTFMASKFSGWSKAEQRWTWVEVLSKALPDQRRASPAVGMYGVLTGVRSSHEGYPVASLRRRTRTVLRANIARRTHKTPRGEKGSA
jgi:hypothetical protein